MLSVPFAIADATTLTEAGYVGEDVENILLKLIQAADFDIERARSASSTSTRSTRSPARAKTSPSPATCRGEGVQQALLKILEGTVARSAAGRPQAPPAGEFIQIDTTEHPVHLRRCVRGLDKIIGQRIGNKGWASVAELPRARRRRRRASAQVEPGGSGQVRHDSRVRRPYPGGHPLDELDEDDLVRILTEPKNALVKQYTKMLSSKTSS